MISAFGVDHGEISKGMIDRMLVGNHGAATDLLTPGEAYKTGRILRGMKTLNNAGERHSDARLNNERIKSEAKRWGLMGRIGYNQEKIIGGGAAAGTGGVAYAAGKKRKKS